MLLQLLELLIDRHFSGEAEFTDVFSQFGYMLSEMPVARNQQEYYKMFQEHLDSLKEDRNWDFHLCAMWKLIHEGNLR